MAGKFLIAPGEYPEGMKYDTKEEAVTQAKRALECLGNDSVVIVQEVAIVSWPETPFEVTDIT